MSYLDFEPAPTPTDAITEAQATGAFPFVQKEYVPPMFAMRNLAVLNYASGFTSWVLKANKASLLDLMKPGACAAMADMIADGDMVTVLLSSGTAMVRANNHGKGLVFTPFAYAQAVAS